MSLKNAGLHAVAKLAGRSNERRSRLHTRRGDLVVRGVVGAGLARGRVATEPWMAPKAVGRLDEILTNSCRLLELGSGSSTRWYAERCKQVVSVEDDASWLETTRSALAGLSNVDLVFSGPADFLSNVQVDFDVMIIDQNEHGEFSRVDAARWAARRRIPIVVLDDSDRAQYVDVDAVLADWERERFVGFRPRPLVPTETTIYRLGELRGLN